jgi:hypothetical protein
VKKSTKKNGRAQLGKGAPDSDLLRVKKATILFNNKEFKAIDAYCKKYGIRNRSKCLRELILSSVLKKFEDDYPTLF